MSKDAANRAMREARYAETRARSTGATPARPAARPASAQPPVAPPLETSTPASTASDPAPVVPAAEGLCGHRSMNGRTCTRESGHTAKSHRYS